MNIRLLLTILFSSLLSCVCGQFKPNSIGVCYLVKENAENYVLTIALPFQMLVLEKQSIDWTEESKKTIDTLIYQGEIILFDKKGEICKIEGKEIFLTGHWCENDGGIQFRPTLRTTIKKSHFKRPLKEINEIQNICCFVIVNKDQNAIEPPDLNVSSNIKLRGDFNQDKIIDCFIWTIEDEAGNCDGEPNNNLTINLKIGKEDFSLRCCGP